MTTQEAKDRGLLPEDYRESTALESHRMVFIDMAEYGSTSNFHVNYGTKGDLGNDQAAAMEKAFYDPAAYKPVPKGSGIMEQIKQNHPAPYEMLTAEKMKKAMEDMMADMTKDMETAVMIKPRRAGYRAQHPLSPDQAYQVKED